MNSKVWIRHVPSNGSHDIGIGRLHVNARGLKPVQVLQMLANLPVGTRGSTVREFVFRDGDSCGWWQDKAKPKKPRKKQYTRKNRPSKSDAERASRGTGA